MDKIFKRQIRSHDASGQLIEVTLRVLNSQDIKSIIEIAQYSFDKVWSEKDFQYFISHESGSCWGLFYQDRLIGYFLGLLVLEELDIVSIAVAKEFRRRGAGESLIKFLWDILQVKKAFLEVELENRAAIKLYEKSGFSRYGLRRKYYAGKKDAVLMKREKN